MPRVSHPCLSCGACCAAFRVSFHWAETAPGADSAGLPESLTERLDPHRLTMRGTWARQPRCVALQGEVGVSTRCAVYAQRPSPCRELQSSWEHGTHSPQCDKARAAHGLPVLTADDWAAPVR